MSDLPVCVYMGHMHAWCPRRSEEDAGCSGTGLVDDCEQLGTGPGFSANAFNL